MQTTAMTVGARRAKFGTQAVILAALVIFSGVRTFATTPTVTVTSPTGREDWIAGTTHSITWTISGNTADVVYYKLALSTDGGITWPAAGTANDLTPNGIIGPNARSFSWTIGNSLSTGQARIRVRALAADSSTVAEDASNTNFAIGGATGALTLTVTAPTGREDWTAGTTHSVNWHVAGSTARVTYYKIALSTDGGITWPAAGTANDLTPNGISDPNARSFSWTIGSPLTTTEARIRVRALDSDSTSLNEDVSAANFTIGTPAVAPAKK